MLSVGSRRVRSILYRPAVISVIWVCVCCLGYLSITDSFSYEGFALDVSGPKLLLLPTCVLILSMTLEVELVDVRNAALDVVLLLIFAPTMVYVSLGPANWQMAVAVCLSVGVLLVVSRVRTRCRVLMGQPRVLLLVVYGAVFVSLGYFVLLGIRAGSYSYVMKILDPYAIVASRNAFLASLGTGGGYLYNNVMKCLAPYVIASFFVRRRYVLLSILSMFYIGACVVSTMRSLLISLPIVLGLSSFLLRPYPTLGKREVFLGMLAVCLLVVLMVRLSGDSWDYVALSLFARRGLFLPIRIADDFFQEFGSAPKLLYAHLFSSRNIPYKGYDSIYAYISTEYRGMPSGYANVNFVGDAYANLGMLGVVLNTLVLALWLIICRQFSRALTTEERACILSASFWPLVSLANSSLTVCLTTHGLGVLLVLILVVGTHPRRPMPTIM